MPLQNAENSLLGLTPLVIAVVVLLAALVFGVVAPRVRRSHRRRGPIPVIDFGLSEDVLPPRPVLRGAPVPGMEEGASAARTPPAARAVEPTAPPNVNVAGTGTDGMTRAANDTPVLRLESLRAEAPATRAGWRPSPPRGSRPNEGTLQFLPGRFEIVEGRDLGQEIRFVRAPGESDVQITIGRGDGPQYRHVQLHEPTVSRLHARMSLDGRRWQLTNLSRTNPVVVNGVAMEDEGSTHALSDGDRVELGEVVLRFRSR